MPRATARATPVGLGRHRTLSDEDLAARLDPAFAAGVRRLAAGPQVFRGLPFTLAPRRAARRWLLLDRTVTLDLRAAGDVSHVVIAHFSDAWRDARAGRPKDLPIGWVTPVGQELARYTVEAATGTSDQVIRRRFEINDGVVGWGQGAFAATPHVMDRPLDWRGPYPAQTPARYAEPGDAGLLGSLPGTWGPAQTGVADSIPSPTGEIVLWLYELEVPGGPAPVAALRLEPLADAASGSGVVVAAVTAFRGSARPLGWGVRRSLRVTEAGGATPQLDVDLGQVFRRRQSGAGPDASGWPSDSVLGWGSPRREPDPASQVVDLAFAPDASFGLAGELVPAERLPAEGAPARPFGRVTVEALPTPTRRIEVEVVDAATGRPMPARVHVHTPDGRYLPPLGHRDEVNPGLNEDHGADVILGGTTYAYVPGRFPIEVPASAIHIEAARGFGYRATRLTVDGSGVAGPVAVPLEPVDGAPGDGWVAADSHVHFISPTTALLQARAEGVAIVNLLATQWGDHHTSLADMPVAVVSDASGEHHVVMGSENRQNMLGHIGLLGASDAVLPMASAGAPEARLGDALGWLMADWVAAARAQRGLAVAVHFPLPYAEVAADIVSGMIDAVEMQTLRPGVDGPSIREWYRFLRCGYRLPIVGGTDKMTAEIPLGAIRTYARLDPARPIGFEAWAEAVRAGRTFVSSGSFVTLTVEGCEPGDVVRLGSGGGTVDVRASASAALPIIERLELVHDGEVVASAPAANGGDAARLAERVRVASSGFLAARVTSRQQIPSAFATSMGAHTSPVYLDVAGRRPWSEADAAVIGTIVDGARTWVEQLSTVRTAPERRRLADHFARSRRRLDDLGA